MKRKINRKLLLALLCAGAIYLLSFYRVTKTETLPATSAALGEILFKDKILSGDRTVSCASCHIPERAFADTVAYSAGVSGHFTGRNTPTAMYLNANSNFFWDGRAKSYEHQASGPIKNTSEMNLTIPEAVNRLRASKFYTAAFKKLYGRIPDSVFLVKAIADFERSLSAYDSPYDRFLKGEDNAMSAAAKRGFELFMRKNTCGNTSCHEGINFGSDSLVNIGIYSETDKGLYELTKDKKDIGKFKSPTLRNVALTGPYMHDGRHKTLREVVDYYNDMKNFPLGGNTDPNVKEQREKPLTSAQIDDLVAFMEALTDYRFLKGGNGKN